jgi:hypothetical protein
LKVNTKTRTTNQAAKYVVLANTMTSKETQVAKMIAMLVPTLISIEPHV